MVNFFDEEEKEDDPSDRLGHIEDMIEKIYAKICGDEKTDEKKTGLLIVAKPEKNG